MKTVKAIIETGVDEYSVFMDDDTLSYSCIGEGNTVKEAIADFKAAYEEMREHFKSSGDYFEEVEFAFYYDIPSFLQEYAYAFTLAGLERITGVNQKQLGHYISGYRKPSQKTIRRIEEGIHRFSDQLGAVKFA
jgi:hypothetical protein